MALTEQLMDADAFLARPETRRREELIDGRILVNEPTWFHQEAALTIAFSLRRWIEDAGGMGGVSLPVDLRISDRDVLAPDVVWYADRSRVAVTAPAQLHPPDLVVEVRSPSTWKFDVGVKSERYAGWGVRELWLVDPEARTVVVRRRSRSDSPRFDATAELSADEMLTSSLLPGFELAVAAVFAIPGEHQK